MRSFQLANRRPFRLVPNAAGQHRFGGVCSMDGITPAGTSVPVQLVIELDLTDEQVPVKCAANLTKLPLLYPFKYGCGGPEIQYDVVSDTEVKILYMSDPHPDDEDAQYLELDVLPEVQLELLPLKYEEARILGFRAQDGFFQPNDEDQKILDRLDTDNLIKVGGRRDYVINAAASRCHNPDCTRNGEYTHLEYFAIVPAIAVDGDTEFWYEYEADVDFCFAFCHCCGTIIAFNVCS